MEEKEFEMYIGKNLKVCRVCGEDSWAKSVEQVCFLDLISYSVPQKWSGWLFG